ncbi:MAG: LLM class flavin-dependent oxidoreductase [Alphaproteobacteria bacterium]|nr:LLM class flavin-dependent oxidoreductase [Alphaproteobacteria bacterium]
MQDRPSRRRASAAPDRSHSLPSFSILDQSISVSGRPQGAAIRDTMALARHCEALGYARFWVSEHHNHPTIVGSAPEILIAAIAATTSRIRVGSAGVMLPHYSAYKVAEQFRVLDAIAPGRIDLGLGRAPGSDGRTAFALNPLAAERPDQFPSDVRDLLAWVAGAPLVEGHPFAQVRAYPQGETVPETWILGSSDFGARVGAHFGLPYSFAWFFTDGQGGEQALDIYRSTYRPSARHPEPNAGICVWALAADTAEEAERQFLPRAKWRLLRERNVYLPLDTPEAAAAHPFTDHERERLARMREVALIGTGPDVARRIVELGQRLGVEEIAIVTWAHDERVRHRSYELLARELIPSAR